MPCHAAWPALQDKDTTTLLQLLSSDHGSCMQSDPNFIKRLIGQLDKQMGGMVESKKKRLEQIEKDQAEIDQIDSMIKSHIQPNLDKLNESIKYKTELRDNLKKELELQTENLKKMERDAAALISSIRTKATKLNVRPNQLRHVTHTMQIEN